MNLIVHDQSDFFFNYINTGLKAEFNSTNSSTISHVLWNKEDNTYKILAVVAYHNVMKHSVELSIAAERGMWATTKFIQAVYDIPFFKHEKEKIVATALVTNHKSIEMLQRLGYTKEGRLKDYQGIDKDCFIYGLTKRQYLAGKFAPKERIQHE